MSPHIRLIVACLSFVLLAGRSSRAEEPAKPAESGRFAGPSESGFLLPNGWRLTPAGRHVLVTDLPLNILTSSDSRHAFVATSGYNIHELTAIDIATGAKSQPRPSRKAGLG